MNHGSNVITRDPRRRVVRGISAKKSTASSLRSPGEYEANTRSDAETVSRAGRDHALVHVGRCGCAATLGGRRRQRTHGSAARRVGASEARLGRAEIDGLRSVRAVQTLPRVGRSAFESSTSRRACGVARPKECSRQRVDLVRTSTCYARRSNHAQLRERSVRAWTHVVASPRSRDANPDAALKPCSFRDGQNSTRAGLELAARDSDRAQHGNPREHRKAAWDLALAGLQFEGLFFGGRVAKWPGARHDVVFVVVLVDEVHAVDTHSSRVGT